MWSRLYSIPHGSNSVSNIVIRCRWGSSGCNDYILEYMPD